MKRFAYLITMIAVVTGVAVATNALADGKAPAAKMRVAVFKFDDKTDHSVTWYGGKNAGEGLADMLTTALLKSGRYRVFERKEFTDSLFSGLPALLAPVILIVGMVSGVFTPTEAFAAIRAGALQTVLPAFEPAAAPVSLVYDGQGALPLKLRAFLDFAVPELRQRLAARESEALVRGKAGAIGDVQDPTEHRRPRLGVQS